MEPAVNPPDNLVLVKIGGALLADQAALTSLRAGICRLKPRSRIVLVHGGGPQSTALARRLGHEPRMINGRRITSDQDLAIALWTMRGELNTKLVAALASDGLRAAGLSGVDGPTIRVNRRPPWTIDGQLVDFGHVGDIVSLDTTLIELLLSRDFVPVVAPIAVDAAGDVFNVNADTIATELALALKAQRLLFVAESGGIRSDHRDASTRLSVFSEGDYREGVGNGWIQDGMRVKLEG
ncbi:MAG: acetylglutamate kinase, partial [Bacteroidota bacterium]